jgi:hypothetical protein
MILSDGRPCEMDEENLTRLRAAVVRRLKLQTMVPYGL